MAGKLIYVANNKLLSGAHQRAATDDEVKLALTTLFGDKPVLTLNIDSKESMDEFKELIDAPTALNGHPIIWIKYDPSYLKIVQKLSGGNLDTGPLTLLMENWNYFNETLVGLRTSPDNNVHVVFQVSEDQSTSAKLLFVSDIVIAVETVSGVESVINKRAQRIDDLVIHEL